MTRFYTLLILISFLTGAIAPACGFSWNGKYSVIEICGVDGIKQKIIANQDVPPTDHTPTTTEDCSFCFQNTHFDTAHNAPSLSSPHNIAVLHKILAAHDILYQQTISNDHAARAPPSFFLI